ncbi:MAG TPA: HAMP domain-containing sensor histidine kinase [Steroidobacteraceae bacterium]|nr:HAMP domain-containing sensor histidine kinase [Steroidobacteraceae bacterium]
MSDSTDIKEALASLARHLGARRALILRNWQHSVERDPELTTSSGLSRSQFYDHIPQLLAAFERRLEARDPVEKEVAFEDQKNSAAEHGLHRWQQGYHQRETIREWGHLHYWVLSELEDYALTHPELQGTAMPIARRALVRLCGEGVCESAASYERLQRTEAASRVRELEWALLQLQRLERQRAETWREAAHDLRGSVGVISNASTLLALQAAGNPVSTPATQALQRSVDSLCALLGDLIDLGRLEAGEEQRNVARFDAAALLRGYCDNVRQLAAARGLFLKAEGPEPLWVEGDAVKVQRIAQNLVLNALGVTRRGGVQVLWSERSFGGLEQWLFCVQDTGPGFHSGSAAAPLEQALREATAEAHEAEARADPAPILRSQSAPAGRPSVRGEGIGLSIVKRLCELLDASLEMETAPGAGTTFRVVFPRRYAPLP